MSDSAETLIQTEGTGGKSVIKLIFGALLFLVLVALFTVFKLPETRITSLIQSQVQSQLLDPYDIYMTDHGRSLSLLSGLRYRIQQPTLELADQTRVELDDLEVRPKLLSLLAGRFGGHAVIHQGKSEIILDGQAFRDRIETDVNLEGVDLAKFGLLSFAGVKGAGLISGKAHLEGSVSDLAGMTGTIDFKLKNIRLDEQMIPAMALKIPEVSVSEGAIVMDIRGGKLVMKNVQLGRQNDDVTLSVTGDVAINRNLNSSQLNLRVVFGYSQKVRTSFSFIESMIADAKQADGRYAYRLTGPLSFPNRAPDPQK